MYSFNAKKTLFFIIVGATIPKDLENCLLPCDCQVSSWSSWGGCSRTCLHWDVEQRGVQTRTRTVQRDSKHGGASCGHLRETKPCDNNTVSDCPRYKHLFDFLGKMTALPGIIYQY